MESLETYSLKTQMILHASFSFYLLLLNPFSLPKESRALLSFHPLIKLKSLKNYTVSMASPSFLSFSDFLARALDLFVVDKTAVATFSTTSEVGGFVGGG